MTPVVVSSVPAMIVAELLAPRRVEDADHVGAVVHRQVRLVVDGRVDVRVVRVVVLALDGEDGMPYSSTSAAADVVLRRQRVRRAEDHVGAAGRQRAHEVRGLGRHVQARRDPVAGQRLARARTGRGSPRAPASAGRPTRSAARRQARARDPSRHVACRSCHRSLSSVILMRRAAARALPAPTPAPPARSPASQLSTAARSAGVTPQARGEGHVADLDAEAREQLAQRP